MGMTLSELNRSYSILLMCNLYAVIYDLLCSPTEWGRSAKAGKYDSWGGSKSGKASGGTWYDDDDAWYDDDDDDGWRA